MTSRTDRAARIRTYAGRAGRRSALTVERLERYLPERSLPPGPLVPSVAFGRTAPVVLEIGCGHGAAAIGYASAHPEHDVLAVAMLDDAKLVTPIRAPAVPDERRATRGGRKRQRCHDLE